MMNETRKAGRMPESKCGRKLSARSLLPTLGSSGAEGEQRQQQRQPQGAAVRAAGRTVYSPAQEGGQAELLKTPPAAWVLSTALMSLEHLKRGSYGRARGRRAGEHCVGRGGCPACSTRCHADLLAKARTLAGLAAPECL